MSNEELADAFERLMQDIQHRNDEGAIMEVGDWTWKHQRQILDLLRQSATVRALALEEAKSALGVELGKINGTLAGIMGREDTPRANFSQLRFNLTLAKQSYEDALNLVSALAPTPDLEAMVERGNHGFEPCPGCQGQPVMRIVEAEISIDCPRKECAVEQSPFFRSADIAIRSWNQYAIAERRLAARNQQKDETR